MNAYLSRVISDAALLAAGRRHSDLHEQVLDERNSDALATSLSAEMSAVERVMCCTRAETGEGIRAKARALRRTVFGADAKALPESCADDATRLLWSLLEDILHQRALIDLVAFEAALTAEGARS